jgi:choline-sulfatase
VVQTPHLDALASRGTRFDAAYCHSPICASSRFTMLAGRTVSAIGAWDNASEFPAATPTLAHHLGLCGYRTILAGKMHFVGPDQLHGFEERLTTDIYPADFAWTPNWDRAGERIGKWYHNMDVLQDAGQAVATYQLDYDDEVGHAARRKLLDIARDPDDRPFFLCASFIHPHDPYVARPEWWNHYDHDDIDLPETATNAGVATDPHTQRIRAGIEADTVGFTEAQARNARHGYYANTSYVDDWLGQLVTTLDEIGRLDDTVIIVTSDHGDMLGDRGVWFKMSFHERSARVPLVIAGPDIVDREVGNVCSHLDLLPTLLDIATDGGPLPSPVNELATDATTGLDGRSLWPAATGGDDPIDETTGEYCAEMTSHPMFMIRRGRHKYIHCDTDPPLLFDVAADPDERINLADDPAHAEIAAGFAAEVTKRWDSDAIRERVLASQRERRLLHAAMSHGPLVSWDHLPPNDVANRYVRNHQDWDGAAARARFPPFEDDA